MVSRGNSKKEPVHCFLMHVPLSPHVHSRQATLHAARDSAHRLAGSYQARTRLGFRIHGSLPTSHNTRSPRKPGRILHAIGVRPGSLTPSTHPKLGVKSRHHRGPISCFPSPRWVLYFCCCQRTCQFLGSSRDIWEDGENQVRGKSVCAG